MKKYWLIAGTAIALLTGWGIAAGIWRHEPAVEAALPASDEPPGMVVLTNAKYEASGVQTAPVEQRLVQPNRVVPGHLDYNQVRRVEIRAPVDAVVRRIRVKPGDSVQAGAKLADLDSSQIGQVRAEVEKNRADVKITNQTLEWHEEIDANLRKLLAVLEGEPRVQHVESAFAGQALGEYRQRVLSAHSRFTLADDLWRDLQPLIGRGAVASLTAKQRETNREVAYEEFLAACEQSRFESRVQLEKSRAQRDFARRTLESSEQKLTTLLGAFSAVGETNAADGADAGLTRFYLIAPIAGSVEERFVSQLQRLAADAPTFVVADTSALWVSAEIRERDWKAVSLAEGAMVQVVVPAIGDSEIPARVAFIGRSVDLQSRAVPLFAEIERRDRAIKPGMFAWVSLPAGAACRGVAVPPGALQWHDGQCFVFVEVAPRTYARKDVTLGTQTPEWVIVEAGLNAGDRVVTQGAFLLKSELLLEREEE